jgi:hypothetical protein
VKKYVAYISICAFFLAACCKEKEKEPDTSSPEVPYYDRFLGSYNVTDLQTLEEYTMTISHFASINEFGVEVDTLVMTNFDQKFDVRFKYVVSQIEDKINWGLHFGIADYEGNRWALYNSDPTDMINPPSNTLIEDTIYFVMDKSNVAFYLEDGVQYEACENCILKAVKQ